MTKQNNKNKKEVKESSNQIKKSTPKSNLPLHKQFVNYLKNQWAFFVKEPLQIIKSKTSELSIWNGEHPIYRFIFFWLTVATFVLMPILSFDYGITWDEPEDVKYFNEVLGYFTSFGEDKRCLDTEDNRYLSPEDKQKLDNQGNLPGHEVKAQLIDHLVNYGPFVNLVTAFCYQYISPFGLYETRHLIIAIFACIGLMFTGLMAKKLGNWQTAIIAFLIIWLSPTIFGHSMNNQKDIPFLAFYIASIYYIFKFVKELPYVNRASWIKLAICMGLLMSIRVGGLLVFAYLIMFSGIKYLYLFKTKNLNNLKIWSFIKPLFFPLALAYFIGVIFWPAAIQDPFTHPLAALKNFEKFSLVHIYEIFEGKRYYMKDFPWYYAPKSILITIPLFAIFGFLLSLVQIPIQLKKNQNLMFAILGLLFVTIFPIAYVIYKKSALYSSWRHLLFVYPSIVVLAALGWHGLISLIKNNKLKFVPLGILAILIGNTTFWIFKNHPYQYLYYNELVGGVKGAYGKYETDYWCQSPREAIEWLIKNENLTQSKRKVKVCSNNESHSMSYYASKQTDSIEITWAREHEWNDKYWDYAIWTTRTLSATQMKNGYFPPKGTIKTIEVDGIPIAAIVKRTNFDLYYAEGLKNKRLLDSAYKLYNNYTNYDPLEEECYRNMSIIKIMKGEFAQSIAPARKAIALRPENYYAYSFLGYVANQNKNYDSAYYFYDKAISYKDNFSNAFEGRGDALLAKNDPYNAKKDYLTALSFGGQSAMMFYKLGEIYSQTNMPDSAVQYYYGATQLNPRFREAYIKIGDILKSKGNVNEAQEFYNKAAAAQ